MTTKQASQIMGVSPSRVKILIKQGRISAVKHGRDWLIDPSSLDSFERLAPGRRPGSRKTNPP